MSKRHQMPTQKNKKTIDHPPILHNYSLLKNDITLKIPPRLKTPKNLQKNKLKTHKLTSTIKKDRPSISIFIKIPQPTPP